MLEDVQWLPHPHCSRPHSLWSAPDKEATEYEVTGFIAALVRLTKPHTVVETGTYQGHTAAAIAAALEENDLGQLVTFEIDTDRALATAEVLAEHAAGSRIRLVASALTVDQLPPVVDLAFLDSGMRTRQAELDLLWPRIASGGLVLVHDASPLRPPGKVRPPGDHQRFDIATPRGLLVFQKAW